MSEKKGDKESAAAGTTTTIGPTIVIRGKLKSDEDLVVRGRIEAQISSTKALHIENSGVVRADVKAKSVKVSGVVVGNIAAESLTEIAADGRVVGDLNTPKLVIADGAAFRGRIDMSTFEAQRKGPVAAAPMGASAAPPAAVSAAGHGAGHGGDGKKIS